MKILLQVALLVCILFAIGSDGYRRKFGGRRRDSRHRSQSGPPCDPGVVVYRCYMPPCLVKRCREPEDLECRANYCGGCNTEYFRGEERVDCNEEIEDWNVYRQRARRQRRPHRRTQLLH